MKDGLQSAAGHLSSWSDLTASRSLTCTEGGPPVRERGVTFRVGLACWAHGGGPAAGRAFKAGEGGDLSARSGLVASTLQTWCPADVRFCVVPGSSCDGGLAAQADNTSEPVTWQRRLGGSIWAGAGAGGVGWAQAVQKRQRSSANRCSANRSSADPGTATGERGADARRPGPRGIEDQRTWHRCRSETVSRVREQPTRSDGPSGAWRRFVAFVSNTSPRRFFRRYRQRHPCGT